MSLNTQALKLGVIGTGAIGRDHIRRCSQTLLNSQVVAVTDIDLQQAARVVADLGLTAEVYPDGHALINAPEVDAVLVTVVGAKPRRVRAGSDQGRQAGVLRKTAGSDGGRLPGHR